MRGMRYTAWKALRIRAVSKWADLESFPGAPDRRAVCGDSFTCTWVEGWCRPYGKHCVLTLSRTWTPGVLLPGQRSCSVHAGCERAFCCPRLHQAERRAPDAAVGAVRRTS